ncbi:MAG: hypothetical protein R2789_12120 [Microthrixaceae bacterium]
MLRNTAPEILDGMQRLVILRSSGSDHSDDHRTEGSVTLEELTASGSAVTDDELARRREAISPEDTSDLLFTSGTTGAPKE